MRRISPVVSQPVSPSRLLPRIASGLALAALPFGAAIADVAPQAAEATGFVFDAKNIVLLVLAAATAWALRVVLRRYAQGSAQSETTKRQQRLQPNL